MTASRDNASRNRDGELSTGADGSMNQTESNLLRALQQRGAHCPICHLVHKGVVNYLDSISYESVNDLDIRAGLRKALGYCAVHGQEWLRLQDTLGTAIIWRDVLSHVLDVLQVYVAPSGKAGSRKNDDEVIAGTGDESFMDKLQKFLSNSGNGRRDLDVGPTLAAALEPQAPCPACEYTVKREKDLADAFARGLTHGEFREAYRKHEVGLCLPHFRRVLRLLASDALVRVLVQAQRARMERTVAELAEVVRKYDYRYSDEPRGDEFKAPARSVEQAAGSLPTLLNLR